MNESILKQQLIRMEWRIKKLDGQVQKQQAILSSLVNMVVSLDQALNGPRAPMK